MFRIIAQRMTSLRSFHIISLDKCTVKSDIAVQHNHPFDHTKVVWIK